MTQDVVRTLADRELSQVIVWAQEELKARADQRRHETILKIKELAGTVGVSVSINGRRGRPPKTNKEPVRKKTAIDGECLERA